MARDHVATALGAPFPIAVLGLVILEKMLLALNDLDLFRFPKRESVHRSGGPVPAALAMAVSHPRRLASHLDLDSAADALTLVRV
jgi:hypothetical protein